MKTNYHTHTTRCMHATGDDEDYVLSAIKGGYRILGFSYSLEIPNRLRSRHADAPRGAPRLRGESQDAP